MTKKRFLAMLLTGAMTLSLAACGGTSTGSDAGTDSGADSGSDSYKIALIQQHQTNAFQIAVSEAAEAKADELAFVIYNLLEAIRIAAHLLMPLMPQTSAEALRRLSCENEAATDDLKGICAWGLLAGGQPVEKGDPLFPRLA